MNTFALCNSITDGAGITCGWVTGATSCKVKACTDTIPSPSAATCSTYLSTCAFNGSICAVPSLCSSFGLNTFALCKATTDGVGNSCGWTTGGVACKAKSCSDAVDTPSSVICKAYLNTCSFNGTTCYSAILCTSHILTTFALCNAQFDGSGNTCGWVTGGSTCKAKACSDTITSPSAATCTQYISSCAYNGTICVIPSLCSSYALTSFALCKLTSDGIGNSCGWVTGGVACKAKECTDTIATPSATICTQYISSCAFNGITCVLPSLCSSYALASFALC